MPARSGRGYEWYSGLAMKPRHAAAVVLAGWYLMVPPKHQSGVWSRFSMQFADTNARRLGNFPTVRASSVQACGTGKIGTDSAAEGNPLCHGSPQRQTYSAPHMRSGLSELHKMTLSPGSVQTGTGSSNSVRSASESSGRGRFCYLTRGFEIKPYGVNQFPAKWRIRANFGPESAQGPPSCRSC